MRCGRSWRCPNPKCLFLKEKGLCNDVHFTEGQNKTCFVCEEEATFVRCPTVKIWEFSTVKAKVDIYHFGYHTCRAIPNKGNLQVESKLEEDFQNHASLKPLETAANTLVCALKKTGSTWEEIQALAESLSNSRRIQNTKAKAKKMSPEHSAAFQTFFNIQWNRVYEKCKECVLLHKDWRIEQKNFASLFGELHLLCF